mgnify:CR=1 FL=1
MSEANGLAEQARDAETLWQWRSKKDVKAGRVEWKTATWDDNPSNPAYRERWEPEYEFRPLPPKAANHAS